MKLTTAGLLIAVFSAGLAADGLAKEARAFPHVSFVSASSGRTAVTRDQFVMLVIEGPYLSHDATPIPSSGVVEYVNNLLKIKGASYVGVHLREGIKLGDVVGAIDVLRSTEAKEIGVSMTQIPVGRDP